MIPSKGKKRHWGGGGVTAPALRTLGPHLSWYIEINGYLPSQLNAPHSVLHVHIQCSWRTDSKRWTKAVGKLLQSSRLAKLRYVLLHNPFRIFGGTRCRKKKIAHANPTCHQNVQGYRSRIIGMIVYQVSYRARSSLITNEKDFQTTSSSSCKNFVPH